MEGNRDGSKSKKFYVYIADITTDISRTHCASVDKGHFKSILYMPIKIDNTYRKQQYDKKDLWILSNERIPGFFSFDSKVLPFIFGLILIGLISPILPPRYGYSNWEPPESGYQYLSNMKEAIVIALFLSFYVFLNFVFNKIRSKIDLDLGFKRIGNFEISRVIVFPKLKILILSNQSLFFLKSRNLHFTTVKRKQIITLNRTGTYKVLDYSIHNIENL
ncbi:hypothetical protein [Dyadobacter frigoris]|nr:hypothetical protein [Dyadobacter frigoris]GLU52937.1 hypothetical protein Dfri01_23980 [Dyadobacter frigoris]